MSGQCTGWVMRHGPRPGMLSASGEPYTLGQARALRAVLITISDAANRDGEYARPTKDGIIEGSLYSRGQATRIVSALIADGWVSVTEAGGGRGLATTYRVWMTEREPAHGEPESDRNRLIGLAKLAHLDPKPAHSTMSDVLVSDNTGYTEEPIHARTPFDEFWSAYPRKVGKPTARAAFLRAVKRGSDPDLIVAGARRCAREWKAAKTEERFIPHPSTWLNDDRWNDRATGVPVLLDAPVREVCGICNRYTLGLIECPTDRDDCPAHLSPTVAESVGNHPASRAN